MLEVRVHEYAVVSGSVLETCVHGCFFSEIAGKGKVPAPGIHSGEMFQDLRGIVPAPVVHENEFTVRAADIFYRVCGCPVKCRQSFFFVIAGDDDADQVPVWFFFSYVFCVITHDRQPPF